MKASDRLEILNGKIAFLAKEHQSLSHDELPPLSDYSEIIEQAKEEMATEETDEKPKDEQNPVLITSYFLAFKAIDGTLRKYKRP